MPLDLNYLLCITDINCVVEKFENMTLSYSEINNYVAIYLIIICIGDFVEGVYERVLAYTMADNNMIFVFGSQELKRIHGGDSGLDNSNTGSINLNTKSVGMGWPCCGS